MQCGRHRFDPWAGKIPWRRKWQPTPVFMPGESHGQKSLAGYSPWGCKESDTTEHVYMSTALMWGFKGLTSLLHTGVTWKDHATLEPLESTGALLALQPGVPLCPVPLCPLPSPTLVAMRHPTDTLAAHASALSLLLGRASLCDKAKCL